MINEAQARRYCYQDISLIENYKKAIADTTQTWDCHHRVQTIMNCGAKELIAQGCYENRPAHDLIFLPHGEHSRLHTAGKKRSANTRAKMSKAKSGKNHPMFGKHRSEETRSKIMAALNRPETRAKMSAAHSGENNPMFGKHHDEETRAKMSAKMSGKNHPMFGKHHSEETRAKLSAAHSGEKNPMFGKHHDEETRAKMSASNYGKHWFNNGTENRYCKECPGEGWTRGQLKL